jgi:hypothetical protein
VVTPEQFKALRLRSHAFHPDWNYTILP